jgi:hypothetical protein
VQPLDRHPAYVAAFLAVLVLPQARGCVKQLEAGFRPFVHAPDRESFSWDMFSIPITRCTIDFKPAIHLGDRAASRMHDVGQPLEWDPVFDRAEDYALAAQDACQVASPWTTAKVQCFYGTGLITHDVVVCP